MLAVPAGRAILRTARSAALTPVLRVCGSREISTSSAPSAPKRRKQWRIKKRKGAVYQLDQALRLAQSFATTSTFDESVEVAVQLGVDPRKPNQNIRGIVQLPFGTGVKSVVAVFAKGQAAADAEAAGAHVVGAEDLVERVSSGKIDFTTCIATPDMMPLVGRVARVLGPRGLMPNPKLGTITTDVSGAVESALRGQLEFRAEKRGIVHAIVGKASWPIEELRENLRSLMVALGNAKPDDMKGAYFRHATIASTSGRGIPVDVGLLNPASANFMREDDAVEA